MTQAGRKGLIAAAVVVLLIAVVWFFLGRSSPAVSDRENGTRLLAEHLKATLKPKAVLVIGNPFSKMSGRPAQVYDYEKAGVAGLKSGFGPEVQVTVAHPELKPEVLANPAAVQVDARSATPLSFMVESSAFDAVIKAHPECQLVVSLIGVPVNLAAFSAWNAPGNPRFALLLPDWRMIGDAAAIHNAFTSGKLAGAAVQNPDEKGKWMLVNSNNVAQMLAAHPQVFSP